jgi:drug/metabolite transporter (DMT)-like permease
MTALGAFAGLFLKRASNNLNIKELLLNYNLYIGGFLYLSAAVLNIYVLKYLDYSLVLPLTSITYIWTMLISYFILKEKISPKKILGVICIILGAIIISCF